MGFLLLAALSALALAAALVLTVRARPRGRAESVVATTLLWNLIVIAPIYVLGLLGRLTAATLALTSTATSLGAITSASHGRDVRQLAGEAWRLFVGQARLPLDALCLTWRERSLVFVGALFAAILIPYLALSAYLATPLPHWDPLWYHDTIVGFTIQNHGFATVDLPPTLQKVNGYVRLAEMTQLWMVIFADRRLADLTNILFTPAMVSAVYAMARRYGGTPVISLGWALSTLLMLGCLETLHSTYVDPQSATLMLGGTLYATLERPRLRDTWLAAVGLALALGAKGLALVPVPVAGAIAIVVCLRTVGRTRLRDALLTVTGGTLLIAAVAAVTYLKNYFVFHNPFWPDLRIDIDRLGIHWPGQYPWMGAENAGYQRVNLNMPFFTLVDRLLALPWSAKGPTDGIHNYGIGLAWIGIPLGVAAFVACVVGAIRGWLGRGAGARPEAAEGPPPITVALVVASMVAGSPALWGPRYHISGIGLFGVLIAWLTRHPRRKRFGESAVAAVLIGSIMMVWWTPPPRWWYTPAQLVQHLRASPLEREVSAELGVSTVTATALARERDLGPGSLLVFNEHYGSFPSILWNNTFSNRVVFLSESPNFLARASAMGAQWIIVHERDPLFAAARATGSGWQQVGQLNGINGGYAFRRAPSASVAPVVTSPAAPRTPPAPPAPARPVAAPPAPAAPAAPNRAATPRPPTPAAAAAATPTPAPARAGALPPRPARPAAPAPAPVRAASPPAVPPARHP